MDQSELRGVRGFTLKRGAVVEPNLHDGKVLGIVLSNGDLHIHVAEQQGPAHRIRLVGLVDLRVTDFREGNTILRVELTEGSCELNDLALLFDVSPTTNWLEARRDQVREEHLVWFCIVPSYGCDLYAIARGVERIEA